VAHVLLSAAHRHARGRGRQGDVLIGNATPKWARLAIGASGAIIIERD
jgi:hypothetical protein